MSACSPIVATNRNERYVTFQLATNLTTLSYNKIILVVLNSIVIVEKLSLYTMYLLCMYLVHYYTGKRRRNNSNTRTNASSPLLLF